MKAKKQQQHYEKIVRGTYLFECNDMREGCKTISEGCQLAVARAGGIIRIISITKVCARKYKGKNMMTFDFVGEYDGA